MLSDRFRWVICQLDALRRCFPSSIHKTLDELPTTLDETYERMLEGIQKQKRSHAYRLFQCLVAAIRPLRVEELAEIFAIDFGPDAAPNLMEGWRPKNAEEAVLSACSTLISIIDSKGLKIVQFSHFSVKEFLTSDRLQMSQIGGVCQYHIPLDAAHTVLARACLTVLLQLDEVIDKMRVAMLPLVFYAAKHWVDHAKYEDVASRVQSALEELFNPKKPYLSGWDWIRRADQDTFDAVKERPGPPKEPALHLAVGCGFSGLVNYLIVVHGEHIEAKHGSFTALLQASIHGRLDIVDVLLNHGADINSGDATDWSPLFWASLQGHANVVQFLLERGADVNKPTRQSKMTPLHAASRPGHLEVVRILLAHGADVQIRTRHGETALQAATSCGREAVARLLLEHGAVEE